ncbi:MAG TPA: 2-dehydropantoate 2-reductase, partial [Mariprofundaceae bacterium]|nr:2-dehydropantoate 2-reductase [Mariprofundaceae bacterium]
MTMRIGVAGAGAVGCHYASLLHQAGHGVALLARGAHLKAMQADGLRHESMGKLTTVHMAASDDAAILEGCDALLITAKTTALDAILPQIRAHVGDRTLLVTLQNGIRAPGIVARHLPGHPLAAGSAFIGARIEAPGHVIHSAAGHVRLAAWNADAAGPLQELVAALTEAGVDAAIEADARSMLWTKLLWNVGFNAITALTRRHARDIAADADTARWVEAAMREAVAVAHAEGVVLPGDAVERYLRVSRGMGEVKTSMWQDLEHGRPTEIADMNGQIAELAAHHGLAAPVNDLL